MEWLDIRLKARNILTGFYFEKKKKVWRGRVARCSLTGLRRYLFGTRRPSRSASVLPAEELLSVQTDGDIRDMAGAGNESSSSLQLLQAGVGAALWHTWLTLKQKAWKTSSDLNTFSTHTSHWLWGQKIKAVTAGMRRWGFSRYLVCCVNCWLFKIWEQVKVKQSFLPATNTEVFRLRTGFGSVSCDLFSFMLNYRQFFQMFAVVFLFQLLPQISTLY